MNDSDDNLEAVNFRPNDFTARVFAGPRDTAYLGVVIAFVVASLSHLWLADAADPGWFASNVIYVVGLVVLVAGRGAAGWALCGWALLLPLLFHRDQLTQSMLLACVCAAGVLTLARRKPAVDAFLSACRGLMVLTYLFAVLHKLNHDFFDPATGCATYGMRKLATYYQLDPTMLDALDALHAPLAIAIELAIPILYLVGRRRLARVAAVAFHLPLTLTMAPAFAFVMALGHAAWLTDEDRAQLRAIWARWRAPLLATAIVATAASLLLHGAKVEPTMIPREFLLWLALAWTLLALRGPRETPIPRQRDAASVAVCALFALNCFTPYLGVQFQHAGAMLSNLRIDRGCWNHLIIPEQVRLTEDYIRFDTAMFYEPGAIPEYEQIVLEQLWSPPQLRQMRRNWCREEVRPFALTGTYRGRAFAIDDLCDPDFTLRASDPRWPFADDGMFGVELFPDYLRFQKNLLRECPQSCIH